MVETSGVTMVMRPFAEGLNLVSLPRQSVFRGCQEPGEQLSVWEVSCSPLPPAPFY